MIRLSQLFLIRSALLLLPVFAGFSCKKFVEIDPPRTELLKPVVFTSDATANAAMIGVYSELRSTVANSGGSVTYLSTFSSDELLYYGGHPDIEQFNDNDLIPENFFNLQLWSVMYKIVYSVNSIIEGISASTAVSAELKVQLEGEAKFIRAFNYYYLVNLFGDVPLITSTDYRANTTMPRTSIQQVYQQIITDLTEAETLLPDNYNFASNERVRVNKFAAKALLARVYLFTGDWVKAESKATEVIGNVALYSLESDLSKVFLRNSSEAIFQIWSSIIPSDVGAFYERDDPPTNCAFRPEFISNFETNDNRPTAWISYRGVYGYPAKYKQIDVPAGALPDEYSIVLRLAEQYLIRAEARAKQSKIMEAQGDINVIRTRAGLPNTSANDQSSLLAAIEQERRSELFTEWGHRWLDLKRTNRATAVLGPLKGSFWQPTDVLYPIPQQQIRLSGITQNPGY